MELTREQLDALYEMTVVSADGHALGPVGHIYLDDTTQQATWVTSRTGLFGLREVFAPFQGARIDAGTITVRFPKDVIMDAPRIAADGHISEAEQHELRAYFRLAGPVAQPDSVPPPPADSPASHGDDVLDPGEVAAGEGAASGEVAAGEDAFGAEHAVADPAHSSDGDEPPRTSDGEEPPVEQPRVDDAEPAPAAAGDDERTEASDDEQTDAGDGTAAGTGTSQAAPAAGVQAHADTADGTDGEDDSAEDAEDADAQEHASADHAVGRA